MSKPLKLYGLKTCDTCKKALAALQHAGRKVKFIDMRAEADLAEKVPYWLSHAGPKALVNTRSTTWRELDDTARALAESDPARILIDNPTLIKRPVIEAAGEVFVGWTNAVQSELAMS